MKTRGEACVSQPFMVLVSLPAACHALAAESCVWVRLGVLSGGTQGGSRDWRSYHSRSSNSMWSGGDDGRKPGSMPDLSAEFMSGPMTSSAGNPSWTSQGHGSCGSCGTSSCASSGSLHEGMSGAGFPQGADKCVKPTHPQFYARRAHAYLSPVQRHGMVLPVAVCYCTCCGLMGRWRLRPRRPLL